MNIKGTVPRDFLPAFFFSSNNSPWGFDSQASCFTNSFELADLFEIIACKFGFRGLMRPRDTKLKFVENIPQSQTRRWKGFSGVIEAAGSDLAVSMRMQDMIPQAQ
jgi:hypothetical protein